MRFMHIATGLDHIGLVGREMAGMLDAYRRLGFAPTEARPLLGHDARTGRAVSLDQASAHLVFEQGYVELSAVSTLDPSHHLATYLGRAPRLAILAIGTTDLRTQHARCTAAGVSVGPVREASRTIGYGDRHGEARFSWFMVEPGASPEGLLCFVQHQTPELVFQRAVQRHPNGVRALTGLLVLVDEVGPVAQRIAAAVGSAATPGGSIALGHGSVQVLDAGDWRERFPGADPPAAPCFAGFTVTTAELASARARVQAGGVEPIVREDGSFWVGSRDASGCIVEFTS